ncbi:unnamed protein product [Nippostrongylus brasiliensis]|uniref:non-specific serine/threonine protein kinase n=1 Tax=Nippostrongylus brasiliensis TaxID=27835 RepID=A0A158QYH9_NIPBR|nr:unnamed protein product [Nippostrongylus brasiliensis]
MLFRLKTSKCEREASSANMSSAMSDEKCIIISALIVIIMIIIMSIIVTPRLLSSVSPSPLTSSELTYLSPSLALLKSDLTSHMRELLILIPLLIPLSISISQVTTPTQGQCQAICLNEYASLKNFLALDGSEYRDVNSVNNSDFALCKLGCSSPGFTELKLAPFKRGQAVYGTIINQGESAEASASSAVTSIALLCADSAENNGSVFWRVGLNVRKNTDDGMLAHWIEAVRRTNNDPVTDTMWKDELAAARISFKSSQISSCSLVLSYNSHMGVEQRMEFTMDRSRGYLLDKLAFDHAYTLRLWHIGAVTTAFSSHEFRTPQCLKLVNDPALCGEFHALFNFFPPPPVSDISWTWNSSENEGNRIVLSWTYGTPTQMIEDAFPRMVHFDIAVNPLVTASQYQCQFLDGQRRVVTWTHRSVVLYVPNEHCNYGIEITVVDSRNRRSTTTKSQVIRYEEKYQMLLSADSWNTGVIVLSLVVLASFLTVSGGLVACRVRDRREWNTIKRSISPPSPGLTITKTASTSMVGMTNKYVLNERCPMRTMNLVRLSFSDDSEAPVNSTPILKANSTTETSDGDDTSKAIPATPTTDDAEYDTIALPKWSLFRTLPTCVGHYFAINSQAEYPSVLSLLFEPCSGGTLSRFLDDARKSLSHGNSFDMPMMEYRIHSLAYHLHRFATNIAQALVFLHEQGCTHAHVTAENVYLTSDYADPLDIPCDQSVKLGDFCWAVVPKVKCGRIHTPQPLLPPETAINDENCTTATDVWQFGLLLASMVTLNSAQSLICLPPDVLLTDRIIKNYYTCLASGIRQVDPYMTSLKSKIPMCLSSNVRSRASMKKVEKELVSLDFTAPISVTGTNSVLV